MVRKMFIAAVLSLIVLIPQTAAAQGKRSVADLIAELKKGDKEKFKAIEELEALGEKAADAVPALLDLLPAKNEDVRLAVAMAMGRIGQPAVEPLTKAFESKDADVRFYAIWGLAFVGPPAKSATPTVVKALGDPNASVRRKAAYALGRIDADPDAVVGAMVEALGDSDADVRDAVAASLPKMSKAAVPVLLQAMKGDKKDLRKMAMKILGAIGAEAAPAIPDLKAHLLESKGFENEAADALAGIGAPAIKALTEAAAADQGGVRALAVNALFRIGASSVPVFVDLLGSPHADVRGHVAALLGNMQVSDKSVVVALGFATKDKDFRVRTEALQSIRRMGSAAKLAEPYVVALLTDIDQNIRLNAFHTLVALGVDPRPGLKKALGHKDLATRIKTAVTMTELNLELELAAPILVEGLTQTDEALKVQSANALSARGLRVDEVLPIFIEGLKNDLPSVRREAAVAIARYGPKGAKAAPSLVKLLDDPDDSVVGQAMATLNAVGGDPKTLFPAMVKVLRRDDTKLHGPAIQIIFRAGPDVIDDVVALLKKEKGAGIRLACMQSLAMFGPAAKGAAPELVKALDDPNDSIVGQAMATLNAVGGDPKTLFPAMVKVLRRDDAKLHAPAAQIIFQVGPDAIPDLIDLLKNEKAAGVRLACLQTLAMVGPRAKDAVAELTRALEDPAPRARMAAARALGNIGPDAKTAKKALEKAELDDDANVKQIAKAALAQIKADPNQKEFQVHGVLTPGDPFDRVRGGRFHVVHTVQMKAGTTYTIDLISQWDNYLRLEDAQGKQLAEDDDGGGFPNARIVFRAPADGWYRIIVTSFAGGASGPYLLKVK